MASYSALPNVKLPHPGCSLHLRPSVGASTTYTRPKRSCILRSLPGEREGLQNLHPTPGPLPEEGIRHRQLTTPTLAGPLFPTKSVFCQIFIALHYSEQRSSLTFWKQAPEDVDYLSAKELRSCRFTAPPHV